jgi:hypothetical protein
MSGFESVAEWNNAIDDLHDGLNGCGLYLVGESKNVDTVAELLQIVPVYGITRHSERVPQIDVSLLLTLGLSYFVTHIYTYHIVSIATLTASS